MGEKALNPTVKDVVRAYRFLRNKVWHTPLLYSDKLSEIAGGPVYLKLENQQMCGAFKVRGALYKVNCLSEHERNRGVVTCSSGNHAQGVAVAASELGVVAEIFVPRDCPETKKEAINRRGGSFVQLHIVDGNYDDTEEAAHRYAEKKGKTYVSSFEDPAVIAGQGTLALEMFLDEPDLDLVLVPAGGGGLLNGVAIAAKALNPDSQIYGVQSETSNPWVASWKEGVVKKVEYGETIADGLSGGITQPVLSLAKQRVSGMCEITEEDIESAIAFLHREHHQVVEGAGAVGVGALLSGKMKSLGRKTGVVISGGNIDYPVLRKILSERDVAD
ncbi:MAG: threonine/serine dehydratase [Thermovirgaceae bacterium]